MKKVPTSYDPTLEYCRLCYIQPCQMNPEDTHRHSSFCNYRVSIKSFPDYKHLLQENKTLKGYATVT